MDQYTLYDLAEVKKMAMGYATIIKLPLDSHKVHVRATKVPTKIGANQYKQSSFDSDGTLKDRAGLTIV